ncbi:helix-turn-helix transcriptional regulator [Amycolatopsis sp. NPDC005232]|uniref:helix-turn-helix transcriptional regulator n=1 Tax=Amycolatopsis sp. NPDC005232 TaxID=3157027 RepID=UPI00339DF929
MSGETQRRRALGEFLRARRQQIVRSEVGLPPTGRKSGLGLRREEISYLSGVSITWYTWLEQGRQITPSRQVLEAIARTLRLSVAELAYILSLAGHSAPDASEPPPTALCHVQRLLDVLTIYPAYAIAPDWTVSGWNVAYEALYPNVATAPVADRNLLWLVFTDPYLRDLMADWDDTSRRLLAQFRAEAGPRLGHPSFSRLVKRLLEASEPFRAGWESHDIEGFAARERLFHHPVVGNLYMEQHVLTPSDQPDLHVVIYTPLLTTDTAARLHRLVGTATPD